MHTITHVDVAGLTLTFHCEHDGGEQSYRLEPRADGATVYLTGTPEQLMLFAVAIADGVREHVVTESERAITEALHAVASA